MGGCLALLDSINAGVDKVGWSKQWPPVYRGTIWNLLLDKQRQVNLPWSAWWCGPGRDALQVAWRGGVRLGHQPRVALVLGWEAPAALHEGACPRARRHLLLEGCRARGARRRQRLSGAELVQEALPVAASLPGGPADQVVQVVKAEGPARNSRLTLPLCFPTVFSAQAVALALWSRAGHCQQIPEALHML